jgi:prepilin-type N-terminal cleavage/methylation domain-containing protein/prepilin-type processing-associated H-X9-DG protein
MNNSKQMTNRNGFTLIELLVVIAIIAILASILFPVFAKAREKARQITCLSNEKQLGLALYQYVQDYDECYPAGLVPGTPTTGTGWDNGYGVGWAGEVSPYIKSPNSLTCPDDPTTSPGAGVYVCSYAENYELPGHSLAYLVAPSTTVELFEVANDTCFLNSPTENTGGATVTNWIVSAVGDGFPLTNDSTSTNCNMNGDYRSSVNCTNGACTVSGWDPVCAASAGGLARHQPSSTWQMGGSNLLLADGHAKWYLSQNAGTANNGPGGVSNNALPATVSAWWGTGVAYVTWNPQ